jgi:hypothetical protein
MKAEPVQGLFKGGRSAFLPLLTSGGCVNEKGPTLAGSSGPHPGVGRSLRGNFQLPTRNYRSIRRANGARRKSPAGGGAGRARFALDGAGTAYG